jgi:signal peptidase
VTTSVDMVRDVHSNESGRTAPVEETIEAPLRRRARVRDVLLALAGIAGALAIIWLIVSLVFGYSIIVFKTGSMAPTMPTGALAVEHSIPVGDIRAGDVVTVPDPGHDLPVTHRVVRVSPVAGDANARMIVLKGDANATDDENPYRVTTAHIVLWSVPVVGIVLVALRQPVVIGFFTLLVAILIVWSFWPSGDATSTAHPRYRRGAPLHRTTDSEGNSNDITD